jgi:hypothetical protein
MAMQGRADLLGLRSNTRWAAAHEARKERSHDCVAGERGTEKVVKEEVNFFIVYAKISRRRALIPSRGILWSGSSGL